MAAVSPRASGYWQPSAMTYARLSTHDPGGDLDDPEMNETVDSRTPLDRTIDQIGMGAIFLSFSRIDVLTWLSLPLLGNYQWALLFLCGFGWMADNMWLQAISIILPRIQRHFSLPDNRIGLLSSTMFAGMMFGAVGWGTCSDLVGRSTAFNATLFFTSLFGMSSSLATTFPMLCVCLFFLGTAVGGSLPTDGTLLLEHMPRGKEYLVTALSVFFSFGAVLAAIVAIILIPKNSCDPSPAPCDLNKNLGWKYELTALGLITFLMFLARMVFFRLHESPRYLVHAGRPQDALESLQMISKFNGDELELDLEDVEDRIRVPPSHLPNSAIRTEDGLPSSLVFDADAQISSSPTDGECHSDQVPAGTPLSSTPPEGSERTLLVKDYSATGGSGPPLAAYAVVSAAEHHSTPYSAARRSSFQSVSQPKPEQDAAEDIDVAPARSRRSPGRSAGRPRGDTFSSVRSTFYEAADHAYWALPGGIRRPMRAWFGRFKLVLEPEWRRTTLLVWAAWCGMSLAYTMFNVYLPKLLETRHVMSASETGSLERVLWDVVIFTIGGCPGAVLGAWLIEWPRLGRRLSLAGSTFLTALLCLVFVLVQNPAAVTASTVGISLSSSVMWAVLYGWTPEIFATKVRGTACGAATALSRVGGMIAPMSGGALLMIDPSFPVYASIVVFVVSGICVLLIKDVNGPNETKGRRAAFVH
ncbi:MFS general substrate transporter [Russula earlei]|uniref:MFS general substrate transporter n=1 Tax=Russula earlei TaxID=71964 RepID=A0ACC0U7J7_9AGAM|nr:MFS general substrate transporter [Russula earlei]